MTVVVIRAEKRVVMAARFWRETGLEIPFAEKKLAGVSARACRALSVRAVFDFPRVSATELSSVVSAHGRL